MKVKIGFYLVSMLIFLLIVIILGIDIPMYWGDNWQFVGWNVFLTLGVLVPLVSFLLMLLSFIFVIYLKFRMKGSVIGPVEVIVSENVSSDNMSFVASYFFPIVSFGIGTTWRHVIVLLLLFIVLGVIYIQSDIYYCNPSLSILGFRTYKIKGNYNSEIISDKVIIVRDEIKEGDKFYYISIDHNTYYAIKDD